MKSFYHSETIQYSSNPQKGKPHGTRNIVTLKNGRGSKTSMNLGPRGKVISSKTVKLNRNEAKNIVSGKFMRGFWKNCVLENC